MRSRVWIGLVFLAAVAALFQGACIFFNASAIVIPDKDKMRENPIEASAASINSGKRVFANACIGCHGPKGDGKGELAGHLDVKVPDLTSHREQRRRTDGELFYILTHGHGRMPAQADRWSEELRWDIVNYIRTLERE